MKKKLSILMLLAALIVPWASIAQTRVATAGNWSGTTSSAYGGFHNTTKYSWTQTLYTQSEMGGAGWVQAIILDNRSTATNLCDSVKIYLGHTTMTSHPTAAVSTWVPMADLSLVWSRDNYTIPGEVGQLVIELDQPFYYNGTGSLALVVSKAAQATSSNTKFGYTSTTAIMKYTGGTTESYCRFPTVAGTNSTYKENIMFVITTNQNDNYCLPLTGLHRVGATETSVTVAWDDATGASFEAGYAEVGGADNSTTINPVSVTDTFYTATGLSDNTEYWLYVRKLQGTAYSGWDSIKVRTLMTPLTLPLSYDFEDASDDADWAFNNAANGWYIGNLGQRRCMFVSNDNGLHNAYTLASSGYSWAWVDVTLTSGAYGINFDWRAQGESTWDYIRVFLVPDSVYLDATYATWGASNTFSTSLPAGWISASTSPTGLYKLNLDSTWNHFSSEVYIPDSMAGTYHMAVLWVNDGSGGTQPPAAIDNISFDAITCYAPSACTVSGITPHEATLNITHDNATDFMCLYQMNGATHYDTVDITGSSYTFTGLQMGRIYNGIVYTLCNGDTSAGARSFTFTTTCGTLTDADLPYTEDFEAYGSGAAYPINACWTKGTSSSTAYPYPTSTVVSGARSLYFYGYYPSTTSTTPVYSWAALPPVDDDLDISTLQINFKVKRGSTASTYYTTLLYVGIAESVTGLTSAAAIDTQVTWIDTLNYYSTASSSANSIHDAEVTFDTYTGTGKYIVIYAPVPPLQGSSTYAYNYAYVDDIALRTIPTCFWPTAVSLNSVTSDEATISWTPDPRTANPNGWSIEYGPAGFTPGEGTIETETSTSITLTNLTPNTEYDVYVSADCGSEMSDPAFFSFRTACVALDSLPYTENFDGVAGATSTSVATNNLPSCWNYNNVGTSTSYSGYPIVYNSASTAHSGSNAMRFYTYITAGTYADQYAIMPMTDSTLYPVNNLQVGFWMRSTSTSYSSYVVVGVMTNPNDVSTFVPVETVHTNASIAYAYHEVALGGYTGAHGYIAIKAPQPSSSYNALLIDDITIELMPPCPSVTNIEATATVGGALLTWDWQAGYDAPASYVVTYDSIGGTNPTTVNVTTNSIIITGLEPNTTYKAYVKADCGSDGFGRMDSVQFTTGEFGCVLDPATADTVNIGNGTSTSYYIPIGNFYNYSYTQQLIEASEMHGATNLTGIDFQYAYSSPTTDKNNVTIYLANTSATSLASAFVSYDTSFHQVYHGPLNCTQGWNHFEFDTPFAYNGTSNLLIVIHDNSGDYNGSSYTFNTHSATGKGRYIQNDSNPYSITSPGTGTSYAYRANMKLYSGTCLYMSTCADPSVIVTDMDTASVTIAWAPGADETDWDIAYRVAGAATWTTEATSVSTNSYTFTGLTPATDYEFRVSFECSDGTVYQGIATATTPCAPMPLPYIQNFDAITTNTSTSVYGIMPNCWDYTLIGSSTYTTGSYLPGVYYSATNANSGSYSMRLAGKGYFMLPEMSAPVDSLMISFNAYVTAAAYTNLVVGAMENGMFVPIDTATLVVSTHTYVEMLLSSYHGNSHTVAFFNPNTTSSTDYSYVYIDDLRVEVIPECARPITIEAISLGSDNATIAWDSTGDSYEVYVSTTPVDPDTVTGATFLTSIIDTITLTGLTPNTPYYFYVRTDCGNTGNSDWSNEYTFRTACTAQPLPYTEGFESYSSGSAASISTCWVKGTNSTTAYPYPSTTAITGSRSLYFYAYHPSSTSTTPIWSYAALPMFQDTITNLMMTFKVRTYSSALNYYTTNLVVGVMDNPHDISTFTGVDTFSFAGAAASSVHEVEVTFNNYTGTGKYIAIYDPVPPLFGANYDYSYAYVDDIVVDTIPNCMRPNHVTFTGITQNSATVHWMAGQNASSFDIEYGPSGFVQGTGTTVTSSVDSVDLTGLSASTQYDVYVRAHCSATDQSPWSFVQSFNTVCGPTALPMFFDPNNYTTGTTAALPNCWTRTNNATGTVNYYPYIYSSSANAHTGTNTLYYYFSTSSGYANDELMAFPEVDVVNYPMNQVEVSFWAKSSVANKPFVVGVMTNPAVASTFVPIDTVTLTTTVTEYTVNLSNYTGNGTYIALRGVMSGTSSYYIYVDDIYIGVMSHCPRAYNLTAYNGTATGATLAWTDTIGSTQWVVEYHAYGDTVMHTVTANSNPFTLTGLTANTIYNYRVAPICSDGVQADWSRESFTFATSQVPATVPYSYDFENGTEWANWQTLSNNTVNWSRGNAVGHPGYSMYLSTDSGATRSYNMSAITNAAVYRDFDFGPTPVSYELTYDALIGGSTDGNYDGITIMVVDPAVIPVSSSTGLTSPWGHISTVDARLDTVWSGESYYLDGMQGVKRLVFFHFNQATASSHPFVDSPDAIDNIAIGVQPCARPYNLTADNITEHSAQLSWAGPATDTYIVAYRVYGAAAATNVYATVTGNSYVLNGLNSNTGYVYWVDHICSMTATDTLASDWSNGYRFATACGYTSLPYSEGFEGVTGHGYNAVGELPSCWGSYTDGTQAKYAPHVVDSGTYANYPHTGTKCLGMVSGSGADYGTTKIAALPPFNAPISTLKMKFWYRMENASYGTLSVGYVTNLADLAGSFVQVHEVTSTTTVTQDSVSFDNVPANALQIAFRWYQNGTWYTVGIDDIEVWSTGPVCNNPTSLHATAVAYNSVEVAWSGTDSAEVGIHQGLWDETSATITTVTTSNYTFTGLTPNMQYTIAVRKLCEDNMTSDWVYLPVTTEDLPCFAPTNIQVSNETTNGGKVTWTRGGDETEWVVNVFRSGVIDTNYTVINTPMCNISGLYSDMTYTVKVGSVCGGIDTVWNDTTVTLTTTACLPPTNVTAVANGHQAIVTWEGTGANEYHVLWFLQGFTTDGDSVIATNGTTNATIDGLVGGEDYDIYVYAYCDGQRSAQAGQTQLHVTGIDDINTSAINLYPNPANTTVTVDGIKGEALVTIVDMNGRTVFSEKTVSSITIDLGGMAKGAYFVRITGENSSAIRKLIVK